MAQLEIVTPVTERAAHRRAVGLADLAFHLAWLLPCLVVIAWFCNAQFTGLRLVDAADAAQLGRHLSRGDGFVTSFIRPVSLALAPNVSGHPDLQNAPVYPLVLGIAFNLLGANDQTVVLVSSLFALLTAATAYLLGSRLAGRRAGALAAILVALNVGVLRTAVAGSGIAVLAFMLAAGFYLALIRRGTVRWSLLCGAASGLMYLTDYAALPFALPAAALAAGGRRQTRASHLLAFAAGFALLVGPWLARNWAVAGSPFANLRAYSVASSGSTNPGMTIYRLPSTGEIGAARFTLAHPREVAKKLLLGLSSAEQIGVAGLGLSLLVLLSLSLFVDLGLEGNRLKWALVAGAILMAGGLALGLPRLDALYALAGLAAAVGAAAFAVAARQRALSRRASIAAASALLALAAYPVALTALPGSQPAKPDRRNVEYLGRVLPAAAVVVTDQPWAVAWYADRAAIWLPEALIPVPKGGRSAPLTAPQARDLADATRSPGFEALARAGVKVDAIYLSADIASYPVSERVTRWQALHDTIAAEVGEPQRTGEVQPLWAPPGWELAATLPPRDLLLTRSDQVESFRAGRTTDTKTEHSLSP